MAMPPDVVYKQMIQKICEAGKEISVSQTWRYSTHINPPGVTTQYEILEWVDGKPKKVANFHKKIDLFYWLQERAG